MNTNERQEALLRRALERARVFDDGSDGADAESAQSVVALLTEALAAPVVGQPAEAVDQCVASITLPQAQALVDYFGGDNTEVLLYDLPEGRITDDDGKPSPAGLYAVCADCPEEGATYLGDHDPDATPTPAAMGRDACKHKSRTPKWDHLSCDDCGAIYASSGWGVANGKWFESLTLAKFYKQHGRLPEPLAPRAWRASFGQAYAAFCATKEINANGNILNIKDALIAFGDRVAAVLADEAGQEKAND